MILVTKIETVITEESAQAGEADSIDIVFEHSPHTFRELIALFESCSVASCWPMNASTSIWLTTESTMDFITGDYEEESVHYSQKNEARSAKYWVKALNHWKNKK